MTIAHLLLKFDGHWIILVSSAVWAHVSKWCIFGLCQDQFIEEFSPTVSSTIFIFTVASLLAEYQLSGNAKKLPNSVRLGIEMFLVLLVTNVALRFYWIPYLINTRSISEYMVNAMQSSSYTIVQDFYKWFSESVSYDTGFAIVDIAAALFLFGCYVYVAEIIEFVCDMYVIERPGAKKKQAKEKKLQENTEVASVSAVSDGVCDHVSEQSTQPVCGLDAYSNERNNLRVNEVIL